MSMLKLHNTLTRKKEDFVPIDNDHVRDRVLCSFSIFMPATPASAQEHDHGP